MPEEVKPEVILKTQKYLGKYVKKPPLSDKLLKKPPFRFLHDIVNTVIKETGFLKGLFTVEELNSENVKERDAKVAFLTKLINAVKTITNTDLVVRPSKIVAGLEPTETNLLLQTIGKAIDKKIDSTEYVKQQQSDKIINNEKNKKPKKIIEKNDKSKKPVKTNEEKVRTTPKNNEKKTTNETPQSTDRDKTKLKATSRETKNKTASDDGKSKHKSKKTKEKTKAVVTSESKENLQNSPSTNKKTEADTIQADPVIIIETPVNEIKSSRSIADDETTIKTVEEPSSLKLTEETASTTETEQKNIENETRKRNSSASRPKSARPKSGELREKNSVEVKKEPSEIQSRPMSSLRPPSVRPSSARPGAPRLRPESGFPIKEVVPMGKINVIVESFDKDDEEETVIIQNNPETVEEHVEEIEIPVNNKGHLVEQILEQITENDANKVKSEPEWQKEAFYGKDSTTKETNNLRSLIQSLTKTANPLGKLLNYLHEDIDAMHAELESWTNVKRQLFDEIAKQKKVSTEMNKPLVSQLDHLNQEIKKIEEEIVNSRSNILRNDLKIKELLSK